MDLQAIQAALLRQRVDGWLFCDHHRRDPMAYRILGLPEHGMATRRWFYFVPTEGDPIKLAHRVEPRALDTLPGRQEFYLSWGELHQKLKAMVGQAKTIAMQYSPENNIPYIGLVDAGTVELIRSFGPKVVTSADLVQQFEATYGEAGLQSHSWAGERVQKVRNETFAAMSKALATGARVTEYEFKEQIVRRFEEEGLTCEGESPIVGFNDHPADPHFEPTKEIAYTLKKGDTVLLDLWARRVAPIGVYYDITWCAFAGSAPPAQYVEIFKIARDARDAAVDFVTRRLDAGTPVHGYEVDDACRKVVKAGGYGDQFLHRTGHSIGTSVHGNGANIDNLETKDNRRLMAGTCFSIEPGVYLKGNFGVRSEIDMYLSQKEAIVTGLPIQTEVIPILK
jgi:Xaa-Pro aminopeptidase